MRPQSIMRRIARTALAAMALCLIALALFGIAMAGFEKDSDKGDMRVHEATGSPPDRPPAPTNEVTGATVFGTDDRVRYSTSYPYGMFVFLELFGPRGSFVGTCSGVFIGPDTVLTAGHCLWGPESGWTGDIAVIPGKDGEREPYGWQWAASWSVPSGYIDTDGASVFDWGVIKMRNESLTELTSYRGVNAFSDTILEYSGTNIEIVGYPGDKPYGTLWGTFGGFSSVEDLFLYFNMDTAKGQSGGPILIHFGNEPSNGGWVAGVNTEDSSFGNRGIRIDRGVISSISAACEQMGCEFSYYIEEDADGPPPTPPLVDATNTPTRTPTSTPTRKPIPAPTPRPTPTPEATPTPPAIGIAFTELEKGYNFIPGPLGARVLPEKYVSCLPDSSWESMFTWVPETESWRHFYNTNDGVPDYVNMPQVGGIEWIQPNAGVVIVTNQRLGDAPFPVDMEAECP